MSANTKIAVGSGLIALFWIVYLIGVISRILLIVGVVMLVIGIVGKIKESKDSPPRVN